ncbi:NAD(P)/FAD-dependent oxidoreductase [Cerasibacillus terrae]|uniref:NAD(P)/FAD-dependent oxidoreductase n=1 Tax=Cerasibacillus terrae TaxID=2498845 RepID=A0A5C8NWX7_9BACI|nr:NAD(P)/FAD-dependent oxidoreductase [Cerasibacillus terrae]TXL65778.1 NAD(P)/FAD-dependent oxidoreductase [Cerasibacillus terrae]
MYDVIIVGAGPAGLSAAIQCRKWDMNVLVIDEFPKAGGRLLGQLHQEPNGEWWNGIEETKQLTETASKLNTEIRLGISVHHVEKIDDGFLVHTNHGDFASVRLLIATGAAESAAPVPGWTLPGVMSIGAAQVMTNVHRVRVGEKGIVIGINVLSAAIAREMQLAGVDLHSMVLPAMNPVTKDHAHPKKVMDKLSRIAHLAPSAFLRFGGKVAKANIARKLATQFYPRNGMKMWGMPIHLRKAVTQINGTDHVESVTMFDVTADGKLKKGTEKRVEVDFVCIAGGLYPLTELAAVAGCPFHYSEELGGHIPVHNEEMKTPIDGLFVAGNITGIESAKVARAQGKVAGLSIAREKLKGIADLEYKVLQAMNDVRKTRNEASIQFHPGIEEGRTKMEDVFRESKKTETAL